MPINGNNNTWTGMCVWVCVWAVFMCVCVVMFSNYSSLQAETGAVMSINGSNKT